MPDHRSSRNASQSGGSSCSRDLNSADHPNTNSRPIRVSSFSVHHHRPRRPTQEYIERRLSKLPPHAARNWLKAIRHFLAFCKGERLIKYDVSAGIKAKVPQSDGFHTWSEDEIARYEAHYPVGSKARLALAIGLYTALRRGDAVRLGRQHIRDGVMSIRLDKTRVQVTLPVLPELQRTIEASPVGELTLLVTKTGKSYGANDFSAQFRKWCDDAGMPPECSFHGLRKAACTRLADARCTGARPTRC